MFQVAATLQFPHQPNQLQGSRYAARLSLRESHIRLNSRYLPGSIPSVVAYSVNIQAIIRWREY